MGMDMGKKLRRFHQARWDEPIIFELSSKGERGILVPRAEKGIEAAVGDGLSRLPENMRRKTSPNLPELSQMQVLKHYLRLSQENLGADFNVDIGQGTCTMKYSPKVNEQFVRSPKVSALHPLQDPSTVQGVLEILYKMDLFMREISGMDRFTFQPASGSQAILAMASMVKAYHASRGDSGQRDEVITTIFSHPSDAAAPAVLGYKIITIPHDESGLPDLKAMKKAVSKRTAVFFATNPEDTGIFNPKIDEFTRIVHQQGGLCAYDQANANGLLGLTRAREAGFDTCFFNLHKTFSSPHGCGGPGCGAMGVTKELSEFLPVPVIRFDEKSYVLDYDVPLSIGKVRSFYGVVPAVVRAYAWIMSLGSEGLREVARVAILNNNYLLKKVKEIRGASAPYAEGQRRIEQVRYSWETMTQETGVATEDVTCRMADFGLHMWSSHHPFIVPQPFTLEPTESYAKAELDEYVAALRQISNEAYLLPEIVKTAPHQSVTHRPRSINLDHPDKWAVTWRAYLKKCEKNLRRKIV